MKAGDLYGGWQPVTLLDLVECAADPYITPVGVTPEWVTQLRAAAAECKAGHPTSEPPHGRCGMFGCQGRKR